MVSFAGLFSDYAVSNLAHEETAWNENKRFRRGHPIKISTLRKDGHKLILVNFDWNEKEFRAFLRFVVETE
jgi:hypothetical protein